MPCLNPLASARRGPQSPNASRSLKRKERKCLRSQATSQMEGFSMTNKNTIDDTSEIEPDKSNAGNSGSKSSKKGVDSDGSDDCVWEPDTADFEAPHLIKHMSPLHATQKGEMTEEQGGEKTEDSPELMDLPSDSAGGADSKDGADNPVMQENLPTELPEPPSKSLLPAIYMVLMDLLDKTLLSLLPPPSLGHLWVPPLGGGPSSGDMATHPPPSSLASLPETSAWFPSSGFGLGRPQLGIGDPSMLPPSFFHLVDHISLVQVQPKLSLGQQQNLSASTPTLAAMALAFSPSFLSVHLYITSIAAPLFPPPQT
ncbi:hypothetical protein BC834DRAFT_847558 [Gloeopeniophorella convolvens]|nr:hypothetical protein BC834DRAFT_847558 [Gloeopeniophorella convolvens]